MIRDMRRGLALGVACLLPTGAALGAAPAPPTNLQVIARTPTSAQLRWVPSADPFRGFKIRAGDQAGAHPDPGLYPGNRLAAFTWTTDDGYDTNLVYDQIFASRGLPFTAFINSGTIGNANKLIWNDVRFLHAQGHEIANHDRDHASLIDDRAVSIRYTGPEPANVQVVGDLLRTYVDGLLDLQFNLADVGVRYLVDLAATLDAEAMYEATLLYSNEQISATQSTFLDAATIPIGAGAPAGTLTTERGVHDDAEMYAQIHDSEVALEAEIGVIDPGYRCRTLAYPNHAHTQWVMSRLNELGYIGARSGNPGVQPFYSQGSYAKGFMTTYEAPMNFPRPLNTWDEAFTRAKYQTRIAAWKAAGTWAVLMAHNEAESDSAHVDWMIDEIAADPAIWIAPFRDVIAFLNDFYVDVGAPEPDSATGAVTAWIHDLDPGETRYAVVTTYNSALEESGWSGEVTIPAYTVVAAPVVARDERRALQVAPNPFQGTTTLSFAVPARGPVRADVFDVRGARLLGWSLGVLDRGPSSVQWNGQRQGRPLPTGLYFVRLSGSTWNATARLSIVR